jgi:broad specificity phosphatase PhoE
MDGLKWLALIRHGESTGNVAAARAEVDGAEVIDIPERDADVPLSTTGRKQAASAGQWIRSLPAEQRPDLAVVSPYLRVRQTAELALDGTGIDSIVDERLRDRELGVLDLLTSHGVRARLPAEAARRDRLGKLYYRPPGGESWTDVLLRLRSLLAEMARDRPGGRVLLLTHEAVVFLTRYLLEGLSEAELMRVVPGNAIANCSISVWQRDEMGRLSSTAFNDTEHLHRTGVPPTSQEEIREQSG